MLRIFGTPNSSGHGLDGDGVEKTWSEEEVVLKSSGKKRPLSDMAENVFPLFLMIIILGWILSSGAETRGVTSD